MGSADFAKLPWRARVAYKKAGGKVKYTVVQRISIWFLSGLGVLIVFTWISNSMKPLTPAEQEAKEAHEREFHATYACEQYLKARLKDPDTAEFGNSSVSQVGNTWFVTQEVRAHNSFNATIRSVYLCTMAYDGKNFTVVSASE